MKKLSEKNKNDTWDFSIDSNRKATTILIIKVFSISITIIIALIHIFQYFAGIPVLKDVIFYSFICSVLFFSLYLSQKNLKSSIHLFLITILLLLLYTDFFSDKNFSLDTVSTVIYLLPISAAIFLLNTPSNAIFTSLFLLVFIIRVLYISDLNYMEDFMSMAMSGLAVATMIIVKIWIAKLVNQKIQNLTDLNLTTTEILGKVVELRDGETSNHLVRVKKIVEEIISYLKEMPKYRDYLNNSYIEDLKLASTLHDIGKIGIPDKILLKPGKLDEEEFEFIKEHTIIGYNLLKKAKSKIENHNFYDLATEIARYHHERWDGTGYPENLKNEEIPLSARIMAVADVYDALITERPYKKAFSHEKAIKILRDGKGTQFDPEIIELFLKNEEKIRMKLEAIENDENI